MDEFAIDIYLHPSSPTRITEIFHRRCRADDGTISREIGSSVVHGGVCNPQISFSRINRHRDAICHTRTFRGGWLINYPALLRAIERPQVANRVFDRLAQMIENVWDSRQFEEQQHRVTDDREP